MKFLLDSNLSHRVAQLLRDAGIDATHVRDNGLQHATDLTTLEFARQHSFVLVSEDTDFGELLARQRTGHALQWSEDEAADLASRRRTVRPRL